MRLRKRDVHFWVYNFALFFNNCTWFRRAFPEQSNTGNSKSECILTLSGTSSDGVPFLPLRGGSQYFSVFIFRWFWMHFEIILHDFRSSSGSLISVYEWSLEPVKMRKFHHFLNSFWHLKNRAPANALWIFWKMKVKLWKENAMQLWSSTLMETVLCVFADL